MKAVAIVQSNYIPWKGYFDLINAVDEFILYDDCQYTRRDWRNRNRIKTPQGVSWLTIPVKVKNKYDQLIHETEVDGSGWARKHLAAIRHNYAKAAHFNELFPKLEALYAACADATHLSGINHCCISGLCRLLGIETTLTWSMDYGITVEDPSQRLLELCQAAGAGLYISGPAARGYLDVERFTANNIAVVWMQYEYPEYPQVHPPFEHSVSVIDPLLCLGVEGARDVVLCNGGRVRAT
jgi:hypothetical protein